MQLIASIKPKTYVWISSTLYLNGSNSTHSWRYNTIQLTLFNRNRRGFIHVEWRRISDARACALAESMEWNRKRWIESTRMASDDDTEWGHSRRREKPDSRTSPLKGKTWMRNTEVIQTIAENIYTQLTSQELSFYHAHLLSSETNSSIAQ